MHIRIDILEFIEIDMPASSFNIKYQMCGEKNLIEDIQRGYVQNIFTHKLEEG